MANIKLFHPLAGEILFAVRQINNRSESLYLSKLVLCLVETEKMSRAVPLTLLAGIMRSINIYKTSIQENKMWGEIFSKCLIKKMCFSKSAPIFSVGSKLYRGRIFNTYKRVFSKRPRKLVRYFPNR